MQDIIFIQYLVFLFETEKDEEKRNASILKAVNELMIGKGIQP